MKKIAAQLLLFGCLVQPLFQDAWAGPITAIDTVEFLMADATSDATFIGRFFGPDSSAKLTFQTSIDPSTGAITYSLAPGSVYLGQSLTLIGTGISLTNFQSHGTLGSVSWTNTLTGATRVDPDPRWNLDWDALVAGILGVPFDAHFSLGYDLQCGCSFSDGFLTLADVKVPLTDFDILDSFSVRGIKIDLRADAGSAPGKFFVTDVAGTLVDNSGSFAVTISPAPEPGGGGILAISVLALLGRYFKRQ